MKNPVLMTIVCAILCLPVFTACGKDSSDDDDKQGTPSTGAVGEIKDVSAAGISAFLKDPAYQSWKHRQTTPIDSVSAHRGIARTFFNDTAAEGLTANAAVAPLGTVIVKEMFAADRTTIVGHAVMAKQKTGTTADTWVFFEGFLPDYASPYYGVGLSTCTGCHTSSNDFMKTPLPAKAN